MKYTDRQSQDDLEEIAIYLKNGSHRTELKSVIGMTTFESAALPGPVRCWEVQAANGRYWAYIGGLPLCVYPYQYKTVSADEMLSLHLGLCLRMWADEPSPRTSRSQSSRRAS